MAGINFDPFTGWVNVNDPNNRPPDAKVLTAEDLLRYEKLGQDIAEWTATFSGGGAPTPGGVIDGGTP